MGSNTGNNSIDSLVYSSWATTAFGSIKPGTPVSLTYSFMTTLPSDASSDDANGFKPMTATQQQAARDAMAQWASVANITFTEVSKNGNIQLGTNDQGTQSSGYAYLPDGINPTYLFTSNTDSYNAIFTPGTYGVNVLIHELGHTLGLKHPGNYDSTGGSIDGPFLPTATDNNDYSVMSYTVGSGYASEHKYVVTPMLYDIQAMQYLYGANMTYHTGNDTYQFVTTTPPQCIWDAGGTDTFDFSACTKATVINLNAGAFSSTAPNYNNVSIAYNVTIEHAIAGSGGSTIYANDAGDVITGGSGADVIYEGGGSDTISGGAGSDTVVFKNNFSTYHLSGSGASLTVQGDGTDVLTGVETLQFADRTVQIANLGTVSTGTVSGDTLIAGAGANIIYGSAGMDTVNFSSARSAYTVQASGGAFVVTDGSGNQSLLTGVERLHFSDDSMVGLDIADHQIGGEAYRLYQAAFNRTPDAAGLGYWISVLDKGNSLDGVAQNFIDSSEFQQTYGSLNNTQFVTQLYTNILHRSAEPAGLAYWVGVLDAGNQRSGVLANISESAENEAGVVGQISNGFTYTLWHG